MEEGGRGGDKRKGEGQERETVDVGVDIKKVKEKEENEKLKRRSREEKGWAPFLLCSESGSREKKVKLKEIKR